MLARAKVFKDDKGNRMLFPAYLYTDRDDEPSGTELWSMGLQMKRATGLTMEDEWLELDTAAFPHIKTEIGSSGFAHGSATVLLFDGPEFHKP